MTPEPETDPIDDRGRLRRIAWIAGSGLSLGVLLALLTGLLGGEGRAGAAIALLLAAFGAGIAALYGTLTAVVDDLRGRAVSRLRIGTVVGLFVLTALLMAMTAGVGG